MVDAWSTPGRRLGCEKKRKSLSTRNKKKKVGALEQTKNLKGKGAEKEGSAAELKSRARYMHGGDSRVCECVCVCVCVCV